MSKMKVLMTGGSGMVGRNVLEHPAIGDFELLTPSSLELNLCDYAAVVRYLIQNKPDIVVHLAGKVGGIQANMREPVSYLISNLDMGRNIVLAAKETGVERLINFGSSCMYPRNHDEPLREELVLKGELEPTNEGYALAKITTARLCEYVARESKGLHYKTLIPCNIYGRYDKFNPAHSHLIPAIIHKLYVAMQKKHNTVDIWGDGLARREFMYCGDLADAVVHALRNFDTLPTTMNVGVGRDHSINEYYEAAATVVGYKGNFVHDLSKPVGMARKLVSIDRLQAWGWQARHTLIDGIERTYQYYLRHCK
ncbi:GDP-L-fucose synthase [Pseudomonas otitidis]|uniref:GDP-L-fucose synthase family protein n=1 Tax=Metapseudomonas otitidis TaxID=319939 RepID=UPI00244D3F0C|nr:GDP-L-fucose synthase [Pseudomonas otitidis]MDH1109307.1 GDP-L-fucose synthase [Pseudomonas otitidis]MDH1157578.1 GDP-L-fucose synthase [Pseudomonas otitidis]MDH1166316.1 GDP-L-fucose synthase [Pseudomonas otitidis]